MTEIKTIIIPEREDHEGFYKTVVTLKWICPVCGGPRGEPERVRSYDGSRWMLVDGWSNPCGHVDKYSAVRTEYAGKATAEQLKESV